jgi:adenylate cyclase
MRAIEFDASGGPSAPQLVNTPSDGVRSNLFEKNGEEKPRGFPIGYEDGRTIWASPGPTLLEISQAHDVPHVSVCGSQARCSTCRVRILKGLESLPPPSPAEKRVLDRISAPSDVRLACQVMPTSELSVARLLTPGTRCAGHNSFDEAGVLGEAAILFVDIRDFTRWSEFKLAFDVVFILNTFFAAAADAIDSAGGRVDKYIGDGLMAIFEQGSVEANAGSAILAAKGIDAALESVNRLLSDELSEPLQLAMGLHVGRVVLGRIGFGVAASTTAIGRVVNLASRLEALAKARDVQLVLSLESAEAARIDVDELSLDEVSLRGVDDCFRVVLARKASDLKRTSRL